MGTVFSNNKPDAILQRIAKDAPTEIAQYILEIAASEDRRTAASLRLVSKQLHTRVERYFWRLLILKRSKDVDNFNGIMKDRGSVVQENLHTLAIWCTPFLDFGLFASTCTSLHTLHCFDNIRRIEGCTVFPPSLKQFVYCGFLLQTRLSEVPLLETVSHLAFPDDVPHDFPLTPLPHLTHFACRFVTKNFGDTPETLAESLQWILGLVLNCPNIQLVVVVVQDNGGGTRPTEAEARSGLLARVEHINNPRVTLRISHPDEYGLHSALMDWDLESPRSIWEVNRKKLRSESGSGTGTRTK
ncbi:hypothetical protein ONZ45_g14084 [Pleurotus djamor]|nr:hypothetical protein ONZ45_g14084 [Pleurotus djamor]